MSRRGGFNGKNNRNNNWNTNKPHFSGGGWSHDEHDDRDRKPNNSTRRVSFKPSGTINARGGMIKNRNMQFAIKNRLEDDEEMVDFGSRSLYNQRKNRRKGSPIPRKLPISSSGWFLVTIPYAQKYPKDVIVRNLHNAISPETFIPHYWKHEKDYVTFYLDDQKSAERLMQINREVQMPDGFKLIIRIRSGVPSVQIDQNVKERMKLTMAKRYNAATKALDLTKFHADPDLSDIFCALFRPTIMAAAIDIIAVHIPDLEALNLNDNKIHLLDHFRGMAERLPNLKILYLANNRISSSTALLSLKPIPLVEIMLDGNSFKDRYKSIAHYKRYQFLVFQILNMENG